MSRELTKEEVQTALLKHIRKMVDVWENSDKATTRDKLNGLAFSILAALDGEADLLPSFIVAPLPHHEDKEYKLEIGVDYFPENHELLKDIKANVSGDLHEVWSRTKN